MSRLAAALLSGVAFLAGCADRTDVPAVAPAAKLLVLPNRAARARTNVPTLFVEVSATLEARRRGLMGRERLPPDGGMLFVYPGDEPRKFWMQDVLIPLDVAFVRRDGTIARIVTLEAGAGRPRAEVPEALSREPVRYVLEAEGRWFARHGIRAGDSVDLSHAIRGVEAQ